MIFDIYDVFYTNNIDSFLDFVRICKQKDKSRFSVYPCDFFSDVWRRIIWRISGT